MMTVQISAKRTPLTQLNHALFDKYGVQVWIKQEQLNHPSIQGNKLHKLKLNLVEASAQNAGSIVTLGGAYSNHIAAVAAACAVLKIPSIGYIRGDELEHNPRNWSPTLQQAAQSGMVLKFLDRQTYRQKAQPDFIDQLKQTHPNAYILPEGGTNHLAVKGMKTLMADIEYDLSDWTHLFCPVGTGGTLAGLIKYSALSAPNSLNKALIGVTVLKGGDFLTQDIQKWLDPNKPYNDWCLLTDYHDGGYGKLSAELKQLKTEFEHKYKIELDPVYTIKMLAAFYDQLKQGLIEKGSKVILLHTGGIQGNAQ